MKHSNYDKEPTLAVPPGPDKHAWQGWESIGAELRRAASGRAKTVLCVDCYHGVWEKDVLTALTEQVQPDHVFLSSQAALDQETVNQMIADHVTNDRVFGILSHHRMEQFFDSKKLEEMRAQISAAQGLILVFGVGAALLCRPDVLIYADMARWEIQRRFRSGRLANWLNDNYTEDTLRKYKRAFFVDWRVLDRHKRALFSSMDYVLDTNEEKCPKMMTGKAFFAGLREAASRPFRVKPYFDPGVWGGQWMKEVCGLDRTQPNYAWSFDGVPEENSLLLEVEGIVLEIPAIDLVFTKPRELLGEKVHARFGEEFPIRFDFLDTMGGGNLSLQVHPLTGYIQDAFGMNYTQDESYYILDADETDDTHVYLGCKTGIDRDEFVQALSESQKTGVFDAEKYVNVIPAKKHDHFLIPAGTIHCSGKNCMVLEISATPYIFTFKLWDWGRLGLDGKPRPIHLEHGKKNIQFDRDTEWVMNNLVNRVELVRQEPGIREERTGLHELEFIETRRHWFSKTVSHETRGSVNVLNLVEGEEAVVESPENRFAPFIVHYAETFIIPAAVERYTISPHGPSEGKTIATIKAYVRT